MREASRPPVHDSAVATVSPRSRQDAADDAFERVVVGAEDLVAEELAQLALARGDHRQRLGLRAVGGEVQLRLPARGQDRQRLARCAS